MYKPIMTKIMVFIISLFVVTNIDFVFASENYRLSYKSNDYICKNNTKYSINKIDLKKEADSCKNLIEIEVLEEVEEEIVEESVLALNTEELTEEPVQDIMINYNNGDIVYDVADYHLTYRNGVVYFEGHKETYYAEEVLPGGGLNIPGRHVAYDGTIRDEESYIVVAADGAFLPKGSIVNTSLGLAKVYDCGCAYGTVDIYVNAGVFSTNA